MSLFSSIPAGGTVFNFLAVLIGSSIGLTVGKFFPERLQREIFNCLGLFTVYVGISMALKMQNSNAVLLSLVLGTITGNFLGIENKLNSLGDKIKNKLHAKESKFTEGFVTATLLFCVGSMAIIGAFEDGLKHNPSILITKGVMDGIASILFSSALGLGVMFSVFPLIIYQGGLTFLASLIAPFITQNIYADISGIGGLMIIGIGTNLLGVTKLKLSDMLPGLIYIVLLSRIF